VGTSRKAFNYDRLSLVVRLDGFLVGGEKWVERTGREKEEKEEEEEGRGRKRGEEGKEENVYLFQRGRKPIPVADERHLVD